MAYITGTATDFDNLLTILRDFLTTNATLVSLSQNWVVEKEETVAPYTFKGYSSSYFTEDFRDIYFRAPGLAQQDEIYVNIRTIESSSTGFRNWLIEGATDYQAASAFENQPGDSEYTNHYSCSILSNAEIQYWIVANGRRFMMVYEIEGDFYHMHAGFLLPYAKPSEYPYPLFVTGQVGSAYNSTPATTGLNNFYRANLVATGMLRRPSGAWHPQLRNSITEDYGFIWPYCLETGAGYAWELYSNPDSSFSLFPIILGTLGDAGNIFGEVQGLYFVCKRGGTDLASEDIITIDSSDYLVFQNIDNQNDYNYCAMLLE